MATARRTRRQPQLTRQLALPAPKGTHGGARPGAGRPRKTDAERGFIAHRARGTHRKDDPVHVTLRVKEGIPSLRRRATAKVIKRALLEQRELLATRKDKHFQVVHFSIQDDHIHLIVEAPNKAGISRGVAGLQIRLARNLNEHLGRSGSLWAERYHRRDLRTPTETRNALRYLLLNVRKHHRIVGDGAFADPYSSAGTFDGFLGEPYVFTDGADWPKVAPRTWLLRTGWRRLGLIDPAETPLRAATKTPAKPKARARG